MLTLMMKVRLFPFCPQELSGFRPCMQKPVQSLCCSNLLALAPTSRLGPKARLEPTARDPNTAKAIIRAAAMTRLIRASVKGCSNGIRGCRLCTTGQVQQCDVLRQVLNRVTEPVTMTATDMCHPYMWCVLLVDAGVWPDEIGDS
jgi:hypothetical protein